MDVRQVIAAVDKLAPFELAESWDHVGLQVGSPHDELRVPPGAAPALRARRARGGRLLARRGARAGAAPLVSHHPLIYSPLARLTADDETERALALRAARAGVAVLVAHTNLDKARGGSPTCVAGMLGLQGDPSARARRRRLAQVGRLRAGRRRRPRPQGAVQTSAPGSSASTSTARGASRGRGRSCRRARAPTIGEVGRDETVDELRLEVVFPRKLRRRVIAAYVGAHPYEEPAFDVVPIENVLPGLGLGRVGELPEALPSRNSPPARPAVLGQPSLRYAGDGAALVRRVAVLPGSGGAAIGAGVAGIADVLVTGDVKYHDARAALAAGLSLVDAPHERHRGGRPAALGERLSEALRAGCARLDRSRARSVAGRRPPRQMRRGDRRPDRPRRVARAHRRIADAGRHAVLAGASAEPVASPSPGRLSPVALSSRPRRRLRCARARP